MQQTSLPWLSPTPAQARTREAGETDLVFGIAESEEELVQSCHLLYTEYLRAGYTSEHPAGLLFTRHHLHPDTRVILASHRGRVVSTATIVGDSHEISLPMDDLYSAELNALRSQGRIPVEVCALASDRGNLPPALIRLFTKTLFLCCLQLGFDDVCVMVNPKHVPLYRRWCNLEIFGDERHYARVNAPAVALRTDLRKTRQRLDAECPDNSGADRLRDDYLRSGVSLEDRLFGILAGCGDSRQESPLGFGLVSRMLSAGNGMAI